MIARYFGSKKGLFASALASAMDAALPADLFTGINADRLGAEFTDIFTKEAPEHAGVFPMLLSAAGDASARDVALELIRNKVVQPIGKLLDTDVEVNDRVIRIVAVLTGVTTFQRLLPLEPMSGSLSPNLRKWLAQTLQAIVDET